MLARVIVKELAMHVSVSAFLALLLLAPAFPARAATCPPSPAPVVDITSNRFYTDAANSIPDPVLWEKRKAAVKPLEDFRAEVTRFASRGLAGNRDWSRCAGTWLAAWAEGGALLGHMNSTQAQYERKWALAAFAMAYLLARDDLDPAARARIEPWLDRVAGAVAADRPSRARNPNNHYYWLGFAIGAAAQSTGHAGHWKAAERIFDDAVTHIRADGTLPRELARGRMALHYHNFSVTPLVMLAELASQRGEDWFPKGNGALHRLAAVTFAGFGDPVPMGQQAGTEQRPLERAMLGWLAFYERRFPGRLPGAATVLDGKDIWTTMTGGNMTLLARRWVP